MRGCAIDHRRSASAALVGRVPAIAKARQHQPMPDAPRFAVMLREPCDRSDRARNEKEAEGVGPRLTRQVIGEECSNGHPREIVIRQRGMAAVNADQNFVRRSSGQDALTISQTSGTKCGIDADLVLSIGQALQHTVGETESPALRVIGCAVGNRVRSFRQAMQVGPELGQRHPLSHGNAVAHDVQARRAEVHDTPTRSVGDPRIPDVPFSGNGPVEHARPAGNLAQRKRHDGGQPLERLPEPIAGDAAADRE